MSSCYFSSKRQFILFSFVLTALLSNCYKDFDQGKEHYSVSPPQSKNLPITIDDARNWYEQRVKDRSIDSLSLPPDLYPIWFMAEESTWGSVIDIVIVPISAKDSIADVGDGNGLKLIIFNNATGQTEGCILGYSIQPDIEPGENQDVASFSGIIFTASLIGKPLSMVQAIGGTISGGTTNIDTINALIQADPVPCDDVNPDPGCYDFGKGKFWRKVGKWLNNVFGNHGTNVNGGGTIIFTGGFGNIVLSNNVEFNPTSGGGSNTLSQYFTNAVFGSETIFTHPTQYPCRNQWQPLSLGAPSGSAPVMPALLTAHPEGIGNFVQQWIQLMATGNYNSPVDAMNDIDWDEVGTSDTHDMMDNSPFNAAALQCVVELLNQAKNQGCGYTIDEAWNSIVNANSGHFQIVLSLSANCNLNATQTNYLSTLSNGVINDINAFSVSKSFDAESKLALQLLLDLNQAGQMPIQYESQIFRQILDQYPELSDGQWPWPGLGTLWTIAFNIERAKLEYQHPDWSTWEVNLQAAWNVSKEAIHLALDGVGLIPVIGEVADITNGVIYFMEGDWQNGTLSVASAVPFVGWFAQGAKHCQKVINASGNTCKLIWIADALNKVSFGNSSQLRRIIKPLAGYQAHHIIPWEHLDHEVVQAAAKSNGNTPWHMNDPLNGLGVMDWRHTGSHNNYNNQVYAKLELIKQSYGGNISPADAVSELETLANTIRQTINANPNVKINDLLIP